MASISSSGSSPRPASKVSFKEPSAFDLFYQLIYMSAVASAGISRSQVFQFAAQLVRAPAEYFRRIHLLCQKLGYDYPSACNLVGQKVKAETMKILLLRMADALASGQPEVDFLTEESRVQGDAYEKEYDRNLASLTKWTDAFAAIVVSAALIVIVNLTSTMIYDLGIGMVVGLVVTAIFTSAGGAWIISRAAPCETDAVFGTEGPKKQLFARKLLRWLLPAIVVLSILLALLKVPTGWILLFAGGALFPLGMAVMRAVKEVQGKDQEIGPFLRSYGVVAMATGTTLAEALTRIDLSSFPNLQPDLKRLGYRFKSSIAPELCWKKFSVESGSRLIGETITIFYDAIKLGGDADTVGLLSSRFATTEVMLRARRKVVASTFSGLTIVMHGAIGSLMLIILQVIRKFSAVIEAAASFEGQEDIVSMGLPMLSFGSPILGTLGTVTAAMVIILALINAYAILAADGGHLFKISFYLSLLLGLSGISFLLVPPFVELILKVG